MHNAPPAKEAWKLYLADPSAALPPVPWVADRIAKTSEILGYHELPHSPHQTELTAIWMFTADFQSGRDLLALTPNQVQ